MADGGKNREGGDEPRGLFPTKRNQSRGIVIHLTGTEGEWDSLDDDELVFSLDHGEEKLLPAEDERGFHVPLSPSSPGSLGNCSALGPSFLAPSQRPPASLVKSLSTELEPKEGCTLRPKPFLSLVKSISTELSRSEPDVSQSKSDSRLNLHVWKQLTQTASRSGGDSRTAPPSPSGEGLKGGFFKMELEDTKRKLSEAMHEPLSCMFSKIMGEESPKHHGRSSLARQASCRSLGRDGSVDTVLSESPVRTTRRADGDALPVFEWPSVRHLGGAQRSSCPVHQQRPCADGDVMFAVETLRTTSGCPAPAAETVRSSRVPQPPQMSLFCVAVLSYGYFILPLGPYISGLALGLALGFLLGLFLIRIGSSSSDWSAPAHRPALTQPGEAGFFSTKPGSLKVGNGFMTKLKIPAALIPFHD